MASRTTAGFAVTEWSRDFLQKQLKGSGRSLKGQTYTIDKVKCVGLTPEPYSIDKVKCVGLTPEPYSVTLHPFVCSIQSGEIVLHEHAAVTWLSPEELHTLDWAEADVAVIEAYRFACRISKNYG